MTNAEPETQPSGSEPAPWNVVVTARIGNRRRLRRALLPLVRLRPSGFRDVLIGWVKDHERFLAAVAGLLQHRPELASALGKVVPIERTFAIDPEGLDEQLRDAAAGLVERLRDKRFHVRIKRRGHEGTIDSHAAENALGDFLCRALEKTGERPRVTFEHPDAIVVIELLGDIAGIALLGREVLDRYPFINVD